MQSKKELKMPDKEKITIVVEKGDAELTDKLLEIVARSGEAVGQYNFLPLDTIIALDEESQFVPGLRWVLRKQRGNKYELRVLRSKHLEKWEVKGEP